MAVTCFAAEEVQSPTLEALTQVVSGTPVAVVWRR
jgi:hypothetical protein